MAFTCFSPIVFFRSDVQLLNTTTTVDWGGVCVVCQGTTIPAPRKNRWPLQVIEQIPIFLSPYQVSESTDRFMCVAFDPKIGH